MKVKFHYNSKIIKWFFPKKAIAFTLGKHIFVALSYITPRTLAHELVHVEQYRRYGFWGLGFLVRYLIQAIRYKYEDIPLEKEAFNLWKGYYIEAKEILRRRP